MNTAITLWKGRPFQLPRVFESSVLMTLGATHHS